MSDTVLLNGDQIQLTIERLSREVIESIHFTNTVIIGVQPRGVLLAEKIHQKIISLTGVQIPFGKIDTTFHRDDFRRGKSLNAKVTEIDFHIEGKEVLLIDDVLYTGRTIRAAMDALLSFGRPTKIELLVLIDRRFNRELPIQPDFVGSVVDTIESVDVEVHWAGEEQINNKVIFVKK
ncbi:MAG TPA: bifunctional pyr operon transcriptional regulator/uracil phosphoribosyltransferase PyrR [Chitinophagales bacterium]|nr:bifunctional pyr operon transcriptional regulator/uracil phosphoribosyltransferase PyrR [Chitinophagales bacterium]HMW12943.1 bifunctional pyr operon transcriptional regulator/uracil phosphoribosyltransferase PyrR [Chitinophagales bacterium]HMX59493.1 bifunctional pyr operon transcriptional regulator/uracil phosphoribosyltransferase PyrR [Chitinophagales bacterium]HMY22832.1 bifunctional pyr operon transcriptional regulator/uracil phosphoribosyltransferase PyrR [Chitinophagales bacterium]HMZ